MKSCFIKGKNVYLRNFKESDINKWFRWFNDEEATYWMDKRRFPNTIEKQRRYLKKINNSSTDIQLAIVKKKNDVLIGTIGLHKIDFINRNADISIIIGESQYYGRSLGKEATLLIVRHAFDMLGMHKLTAGMIEENLASYRLFSSLGFKKEGVIKEQIYLHGKYRNILKLGLLKKFYEQKRSK